MPKKNIAFLGLVKQLDQMFRIDYLFSTHPNQRYTLEQVASMLKVSTRTVERLYKVMKKFGAPIDTLTKLKGGATGGTCYKLGPRTTYRLELTPALMDRIMSGYRVHQEQAKAMREKKKLKRIKSLLLYD